MFKWIRAIKQYPVLLMKYEELWLDHKYLRAEILKLKNIISKYEKDSADITRKLLPDMQGIFEAHRRAARQSINDAYEIELEYKKKLNAENPRSPPL